MKQYVLPYQTEQFLIWHISILLNIHWKRSQAEKKILKTNVNNGNCDNMGNTNKNVIHIPWFKTAQHVFISDLLVFKNFPDLQQIFGIEKNVALADQPKY